MEFNLKDRQIDQLIQLRQHKKSFHIKAFLGFGVMAVICFFPLTMFFFSDSDATNWWDKHKLQLLSIAVLVVVLYKIIDIFFLKTLLPLGKDIREKIGVIEKHQIIRKQHFPITNDFFFFFAERNIPNIPVDAMTFKHYQVGDYYSLHKAKHSKVIFEDIDRELINVDHDFEEVGQ